MATSRWISGPVERLLTAACVAVALAHGAAAGPATPAKVPVPNVGSLDAEIKCLALAVYWEGKAEPDRGQAAIAHTVLNRTHSAGFPDTVCGVVAQGANGGGRGQCQFSWWCDGKRDEPREAAAWKKAIEIARAAKDGRSDDPTGGALYFHNDKVRPSWADSKKRLTRIGDHVFYR